VRIRIARGFERSRFVWRLLVALCASSACGLDLRGTGTVADARDAAGATFACGTEACTAGVAACCANGTTFTCVALDAGCPTVATDAALPSSPPSPPTPSPPPLRCTSHSDCVEEEVCCYDTMTGSNCAPSCAGGQGVLCRLGEEEACGSDGTCDAMIASPAPGVGHCTPGKVK
jgi:hypothetical protein